MRIKLPSFSRTPTATGGVSAEAEDASISASAPGERLRQALRQLRAAARYVMLFFAVFLVFVWISLPTRAIAWRIGQAARDAGYIIEVDDVSVSPFGGATLKGVTWTFQPSHSGQIPRKLILDEVDVNVSLLGLLFGRYDIEIDTNIDDATIHAAYTRSDEASTIQISVQDLMLYDVPKLQQAVNAPLVGIFGLEVDLTLPENLFANAEGTIVLECAACRLGDNETLLYIPGASGIMAKGVTMPEIDMGSLRGTLVVAGGKATAEKFETTSDDITLKLTGSMDLADPFSRSQFAFDLKLLLTQALQDRSEWLKLTVQTAGPSTKLEPPEDNWLGFKLRGSAGRPRFMGINTKSPEERNRERRQALRERDAKRKADKAKRDAEAKRKKAEAMAPDEPSEVVVPPTAEPEPDDRDDRDQGDDKDRNEDTRNEPPELPPSMVMGDMPTINPAAGEPIADEGAGADGADGADGAEDGGRGGDTGAGGASDGMGSGDQGNEGGDNPNEPPAGDTPTEGGDSTVPIQ